MGNNLGSVDLLYAFNKLKVCITYRELSLPSLKDDAIFAICECIRNLEFQKSVSIDSIAFITYIRL